jgi:hypothetical protein
MFIQLYRNDEMYLKSREVVSRLVQSMPTVRVDWAQADQMLGVQLQRLVDLGAPEAIRMAHTGLFGETAYIELRLPEYPGMTAAGVVHPYDSICLECPAVDCEQFLLDVGRRMAAILGYQIMTEPEWVAARQASKC